MQEFLRIRDWLREHFPQHPHIYPGVSGATLLHEALKTQTRTSVVMPAFICPSLSEMAARAGKQVVHIDADPLTLHPDMARLVTHLARQNASETVLLIDHSFGYPLPGLASLRQMFPRLLIIEDCARALGAKICGQFPGRHADWLLLSMYKTILGSRNGAILLTREPIALTDGRSMRATAREWAATIPPFRWIHDSWKRRHPDFGPRRNGLLSPDWTPEYGIPSDLCVARFGAELQHFEARASARASFAGELTDGLSQIPSIECVQIASGCQSAHHFVSFTLRKEGGRDRMLTGLHRKGFFLYRTWDIVPAHYHGFSLAEHIVHVPVNLFLNSRQRDRLVPAIRTLVLEHLDGCYRNARS